VADRGQHALGVELDALDRVLAVAHAHHQLVPFVIRRRRHLEALGDLGGDQRVVAPGSEPLVEPPIDAPAVVVDRERLAVDRLGRAPEPIHGKAFPVDHDGRGVYRGLDQGFRAGRYHSLIATEIPECFEVTATTDHEGDELVMGVRHREYPIECVQFHPESVLTAVGHDVIRNFLDGVA